MVGLDGQREVLPDREMVEHRGNLVGPRHSQLCPSVGRHPGDLPAVEIDPAAVRHGQFPAQLVQGRGLAGTVGTDQGMQFAAGHLQGEVAAGLDGTEALIDRQDGEQWLSHGCRFPLRSIRRSPFGKQHHQDQKRTQIDHPVFRVDR
jgi:hypothetical protein